MARGWSTGFGSGTTDRLTVDWTSIPTKILISAWVFMDSTWPKLLNGRILAKHEALATPELSYYVNSNGNDIFFDRNFTTSDGSWRANVAPWRGQWNHMAVYHDGVAGSVPQFWVDGTDVTFFNSVTTLSASAGSLSTTSDKVIIGNKGNGGSEASDQAWEGLIACVAVYDIGLGSDPTDATILSLAEGDDPRTVTQGSWSLELLMEIREDDTGSTEADASGNGRTGTYAGSPVTGFADPQQLHTERSTVEFLPFWEPAPPPLGPPPEVFLAPSYFVQVDPPVIFDITTGSGFLSPEAAKPPVYPIEHPLHTFMQTGVPTRIPDIFARELTWLPVYDDVPDTPPEISDSDPHTFLVEPLATGTPPLSWLPRTERELESAELLRTDAARIMVEPILPAVYDPAEMGWIPAYDDILLRPEPRTNQHEKHVDFSTLLFDPQNLEWVPTFPDHIADFQAVIGPPSLAFPVLSQPTPFDPQNLEWLPTYPDVISKRIQVMLGRQVINNLPIPPPVFDPTTWGYHSPSASMNPTLPDPASQTSYMVSGGVYASWEDVVVINPKASFSHNLPLDITAGDVIRIRVRRVKGTGVHLTSVGRSQLVLRRVGAHRDDV